MNRDSLTGFVNDVWDDSIVPNLVDYVKIPNKSPMFDPQWQENGHMEKAVELIAGWCREQKIEGLTVEVVRLAGRTPWVSTAARAPTVFARVRSCAGCTCEASASSRR